MTLLRLKSRNFQRSSRYGTIRERSSRIGTKFLIMDMHHLFGKRLGVERGTYWRQAAAVNGWVCHRCRQVATVAGGSVYSCCPLTARKHHSYVIMTFESLSWRRRRRAVRLRQRYRRCDRRTYTPEDFQAVTVTGGCWWWRK